MADVDQLLSRLKSYKFVTIVVTLAAIVAGIASFTDSVRKITGFIRETLGEKSLHDKTKAFIVKSTSDFPLSDEELLDTYWFHISPYDEARYSLMIHLKVNYKNGIFNTKSYLASIPPLILTKPPKDFITYRLEQADLGAYVLYLKFKEEPRPTEEMQLSAGSRLWTVQLGAQQWKSYQRSVGANKPFQWWGAQSTLLLTLEDPDWAVLSSARLLPLREANSSLLEVIVDNRTDIPLPLEYLLVTASHPWIGPEVSCSGPDPVQRVTLNWQQNISTSPGQEAISSWTKLSESDVLVPTQFNLGGGCNGGFGFRADVPLQMTVEPKELKRIALKILEVRENSDSPRSRNLTTLRNWQSLAVSLKPADLLYPAWLTIVDKGQGGQSDSPSVGRFRPATQGRSERRQSPALAQPEKDTGVSWIVHYDRKDDTGFFLTARGDMAPVLTGAKRPEDAAMAFFIKYAALFRMEDPRHELTLEERIVTDEGRARVRFTQHVNQVPVYPTSIDVHFNAEGQIDFIQGSYVPNVLGMSTRPAFAPAAAVAKAKADLSTLYLPEALVMSLTSSSPELVIYAHEGAPVLAYRLHLTDQSIVGRIFGVGGKDEVSAEYWINAKNGKIIEMNGGTR
jgi:hypothetical protein